MADQEKGQDYKGLIEAALFVSGKAMSQEELATAIGMASVGALKGILNELIQDYEQRNSALIITKIGEKYLLGVRETYIGRVNHLAGAPDISKGALRILAYISKEEPAMQSGIVKTFGSTSYDYIKELLEKDFISAKKSGRSKILDTTPKFREYFSL